MGFLNNIKNIFKRSADGSDTVFGYSLNYNKYGTFNKGNAMTLAAVNRCVKVIMDAVASLPIRIYVTDADGYKREVRNDLSWLLGKKPNGKMNSFTFFSLIVKDILLNGNAYALIVRENGKIVALKYISPSKVTIYESNSGVEYELNGVKERIPAEDMLHFMNFTDNGVYGISVLQHAARALSISDFGDKSAENFYKSGGCTSGFLKFDGPSNSKQREEVLAAWNSSTGGPNNGPNGIAVLPANVSYTQLSVSPADAQLLESRKFEVIDICRFFGVSPTKCFDMEKATYSNVEATELAFLNDTLRPLLAKIETELETKLFGRNDNFDIKFDVRELLRTDKNSQSEYFTKLFNLGVMTTNEIRKELDLTPVEGGDEPLVQVNLAKLKNIGNLDNLENTDTTTKTTIDDPENN